MMIEVLRREKSRAAIACVINLLAVSTVFMTQSIFLDLSEFFSVEITQARFAFSVVSLFYAVAFLFLGPAADKFNLPGIAVTGLVSLSAAVLMASAVSTFRWFVVAMAAVGVSAALVPASMFPHTARTAPQERLGIYMGMIVASGTLGVILGRVAMGVLTSLYGWQHSFRLVSAALLSMALLTFLSLFEKRTEKEGDSRGLAELYKNSFGILISPRILSLLLAGFSLFVGFLGMVTFLTYRLIAPPFNFTSGQVGWIGFGGITALVAPFAGSLSQKVGIYRIIFPALLVILLALQLMGWFQSIAVIVLGLLLLFLGVYACQPLLFLLVGQNVPAHSMGSASSLYILFCIGGGSLASIFLGPVWTAYGWRGITVFCSVAVLISLLIMTLCRRQAGGDVQIG